MILTEIKKYLRQTQAVSLFELSHKFNTNTDVMRDMLSHWVRKGHVRCLRKTSACGSSCQKCSPAITEVYEWVNI